MFEMTLTEFAVEQRVSRIKLNNRSKGKEIRNK